MNSVKFWTASSISLGDFKLVFRFIFVSIISRNLAQLVELIVRNALLGLGEEKPSKEKKDWGMIWARV